MFIKEMMDTHGYDMKSKYIDLVPGTAKEVKLLGNVYDEDDKMAKQSKNKEPIMKQVPLLFRIMEVKEDESYFFTIKQLNLDQQLLTNHRHGCHGGAHEHHPPARAAARQQRAATGCVGRLLRGECERQGGH
mgnify:CR=1 FL=1